MKLFERRQWEVREYPFRPDALAHTETIMTTGNGLLGIRGSFEEGYPGDDPTILAAGIFNYKPEEQLAPDLVAMPNFLSLGIQINGERFRLDQGTILGFERILDLRQATLRRGVLWLSPKGTILRLAFERFASLANQHAALLRVLIQVLSEGEHELILNDCIDGTVLNPGRIDHWAVLEGQVNADGLEIAGRTLQSGYEVAIETRGDLDGVAVTWHNDQSNPRMPARSARFTLRENESCTFTRFIAIHTSRDVHHPAEAAQSTVKQLKAEGYDAHHKRHLDAWAKYWQLMDIQVEGDEVAQRALRFCTYHLLIATPTQDERVSIAAKTLSGFGYKGHVFWDTELFMLPPLTLAYPEAARRLLMYRWHNLPGARTKAAEAGYKGAMFPWESTDTGEETTPRWTDPHPITGERIRIWTGDHEQHISSDIAYAVIQYWKWTGDDAWLTAYGAELVLDTARFWRSRVEYNNSADRFELAMQIGPDEYHENINNSVFANYMVKWHLEQALTIWGWLTEHHADAAQRLAASLEIDNAELSQWRTIAEKMFIPMSKEGGGIFAQFEDFFERLQPINLHDYSPRTKNMDWILGHARTQHTRVIKQADVVMLMALLGNKLGDQEFLRRNWDFYSKVVDHGSSLSPAMHAWVASRLGLVEEAYELFLYSATIDLDDHKGNVRDGIHAASCGGVWQAVVFGFCGLHQTDGELHLQPNLPEHWRRLRFQIKHRGEVVQISIEQPQPGQFRIEQRKGFA